MCVPRSLCYLLASKTNFCDYSSEIITVITIVTKCCVIVVAWLTILCARHENIFGHVITFALTPTHVFAQVVVLFASESDLCECSTEIITIITFAPKCCVIVVAWLAILCARHKNIFDHLVTFVLKPAHVCAQLVVLFASESDICECSTEIITIAPKCCVIVVAWLAILCERHKNIFGHVVTHQARIPVATLPSAWAPFVPPPRHGTLLSIFLKHRLGQCRSSPQLRCLCCRPEGLHSRNSICLPLHVTPLGFFGA